MSSGDLNCTVFVFVFLGAGGAELRCSVLNNSLIELGIEKADVAIQVGSSGVDLLWNGSDLA
eukprot:1653342-Amphidinium_carterae.1